MAYRLKNAETRKLSVAELESLESRSQVTGERDLKPKRLKWMRSLLKDGQFSRCEWAVCHCLEDGKWYRVNGQHSSHILRSVVDGNEPEDCVFPEGIPVTLQYWECDKCSDLIDVFDQFDTRDSSRSADDKLGQYAAQKRDMIGIDRKFINKMLAGVECFRNLDSECPDWLSAAHVPSAYHRGVLLDYSEVREFICLMSEMKDAAFTYWQSKAGICARLFKSFLDDRENARLAIENLLYEADSSGKSTADKLRRDCTKIGKDSGYFWREIDKYFRSITKQLSSESGREALRQLIREVMDESATTGELVEA